MAHDPADRTAAARQAMQDLLDAGDIEASDITEDRIAALAALEEQDAAVPPAESKLPATHYAPPFLMTAISVALFRYVNWRGETAERRVIVERVWFGRTVQHTAPQWFLSAIDLDRGERRDFAMRDMIEVRYGY